jgi:hypothetical protein
MKFLYFLAALGMFFCSQVYADCSGVSCDLVLIERIVVSSSGVSVRTSGDESKLSCDAGSGNYLALEREHANFNAIYSVLLASHTIDNPLRIRVVDTGPCYISYVVSDK